MINSLKLKFYIPYLLIKKLAKPMKIKIDWEIFEENIKKFQNFFEQHRENILIGISKRIGLEWREKDITIYPLPDQIKEIPSMAHPLLLKIREDFSFDIYLLVHELFHRFIEETKELERISVRKINTIKAEAIVEFLTVDLISELFGEEKAEDLHKKEKEIVTTRDMKESYKLAEEFKKKFDINLPSPKRFIVLLEG